MADNLDDYVNFLHTGRADFEYQTLLRDPRTRREHDEPWIDRQIVNELWSEPLAPPIDNDPVAETLFVGDDPVDCSDGAP